MPSRVAFGGVERVPETADVKKSLITGGWAGFISDTNNNLLGPGAALLVENLIPANESLTFDRGWSRYEEATKPVPLGGMAWGFPGTGTGNPILKLDYLPFNGAIYSEGLLAISVNANATNGTLFWYATALGLWSIVGTATAGIPTGETNIIDSTFYPLAVTGATRGPGILIFTTGVEDPTNCGVWYTPDAGNQWAVFPMPTATPNLTNFRAASVTNAHERVFFLNTYENGGSHPQRLRWSTVGWSTVAAANFDTSKAGAGAADLNAFQRPGVKVLPIGQSLACYFEDGVALVRWTGNVTNPFTIASMDRRRGLLSANAACDIGNGTHFGVFDDGFFLFNENGQWQELGVTVANGTRIRKFTEQFFDTLDWRYRKTINVLYDRERRFVYINFSTGTGGIASNNKTWIYEFETDRLWPQIFTIGGASGGTAEWPTAMCIARDKSALKMRVVHASRRGYVWEHNGDTSDTGARDGTNTVWRYQTGYQSLGDPFVRKTITAHSISYQQLAAACTIAAESRDGRTNAIIDGTSVSKTQNTVEGGITTNGGEQGVMKLPVHGTAYSMQHRFSGTHPIRIHGFEQTYTKTGDSR